MTDNVTITARQVHGLHVIYKIKLLADTKRLFRVKLVKIYLKGYMEIFIYSPSVMKQLEVVKA